MSSSTFTRRRFLALSGGGIAVAGAAAAGLSFTGTDAGTPIGPNDPVVARAEAAAGGNGRVVRRILTAAPTTVDLGGVTMSTWAYDGVLPGTPVRATVGDTLDVTVRNQLPAPTTVHWHGLAVRNDMDGVPGVAQSPIRSGQDFSYRFLLRDPGTYWFHPHVGTQLDRGLYAPLVREWPSLASPLQ